ncbi:MAG: hypothetical protein AAGF97_09085, partial [Planctomycetota bacterium]
TAIHEFLAAAPPCAATLAGAQRGQCTITMNAQALKLLQEVRWKQKGPVRHAAPRAAFDKCKLTLRGWSCE